MKLTDILSKLPAIKSIAEKYGVASIKVHNFHDEESMGDKFPFSVIAYSENIPDVTTALPSELRRELGCMVHVTARRPGLEPFYLEDYAVDLNLDDPRASTAAIVGLFNRRNTGTSLTAENIEFDNLPISRLKLKSR